MEISYLNDTQLEKKLFLEKCMNQLSQAYDRFKIGTTHSDFWNDEVSIELVLDNKIWVTLASFKDFKIKDYIKK